MNVLALSLQDPRIPIHGGARLHLSIAGALAMVGANVVYMAPSTSTEVKLIYVRTRHGSSQFTLLKAPFRINSLASLNIIKNLLKIYKFNLNFILCLDRRLFLLCKGLSNLLGVPLISLMDAPRYMHTKELLSIGAGPTEALKTPAGLAFYHLVVLMSDYTIAPSSYVEEKLQLLAGKITAIEPTFVLLDGKSDILPPTRIDELPDELVLLSAPLKMSLYLILKTKANFVVTGPSAYYLRHFLSSRGVGLGNVYLLHNINDRDLERLHNKVALAVIARPALTGISITLLQELYFHKPILTDANTANKLNGLMTSGGVMVNNDYRSWNKNIEELLDNKALRSRLSRKAEEFFDLKLRPQLFATRLLKVLSPALS